MSQHDNKSSTRSVFISYKREDEVFARRLRDHCLDCGHSVWMDIFDIPKGAVWTDAIEQALRDADVVVGVMSPRSVESRNVKNEWDWTIVNGSLFDTRLLLVLLEKCVVPMNYISLNYIDFTAEHDRQRSLAQLERALVGDPNTVGAVEIQPAIVADAYTDYLQKLYDRIDHTLNHILLPSLRGEGDTPEPIPLQLRATPDAVDHGSKSETTPPPQPVMIDPLFASLGIDPPLAVSKPTEATSPGHHDPDSAALYDVFGQAAQHYGNRLLLLGEPGAGKTVTLLHYARDAIVRRRQDASAPLPVLGLVATWDGASGLDDWLAHSYGAPHGAEDLIQQGKALLLLDGLDELPGQDDDNAGKGDLCRQFVAHLNHLADTTRSAIILTCRAQNYAEMYPLNAANRSDRPHLNGAVTLQPMDESQIGRYLHALPELRAALAQDDHLRQFLQTPLLLSFFAFAYDAMTPEERRQFDLLQSSTPNSGDLRDRIFMLYVEKRYAHEQRKHPHLPLQFRLDDVKAHLGRVAMYNAANIRATSNLFRRDHFTGIVIADQLESFLDLATELNLLIVSGVSQTPTYRFVHLLLRDTFAYAYSRAHLRDVSMHLEKRGFADENPILALGRLDDPRAFEPLVQVLLDSREDRVLRCNAARALAMLDDERAFEPFREVLLRDIDDYDVQVDVSAALVKRFADRAFEPLAQALNSRSAVVREHVAAALGLLRDQRSILPLSKALRDGAWKVRSNAARALGVLGDSLAVEPLIAAFADPHKYVRCDVARALGDLADPRAIPVLAGGLQDEESKVRSAAQLALERIGTPEALEAVHSGRQKKLRRK
jgi:HEAT repeat protein